MTGSVTALSFASVPLLNGIPTADLALWQAEATERDYPAGRTILVGDAWGNAVFWVLAGWVKVRLAIRAETTTVAILGSGSVFGEMAVLDVSPRSTDVIALSDVKIAMIPAKIFTQLMQQQPQVSYRLAQQMAQRIRQTNQRLQLRHQSGPVRFVHTLVQLAEAQAQPTTQARELFNIPLQDLADLADLSLLEASKIREKLISQGILKMDPEAQTLTLWQYEKLVQATQLV